MTTDPQQAPHHAVDVTVDDAWVIGEYWNQLCGIAHAWREIGGYDRAR